MIKINYNIAPSHLSSKIEKLWELSEEKIQLLEKDYDPLKGSPVFTVDGIYTSRGWTDWTQGFQFGSAILQYDATGIESFLELGRSKTVKIMAPHVTHFGSHDHGFNNVSTYGNLLRLIKEGKIKKNKWERDFYELALKCSAAVQARRWTDLPDGEGYIYSFNGPHSLFIDTIRSLRSLAIGYKLEHAVVEENEQKISLLERLIVHARTTATYSIFYGEGRDEYDEWGRTAHECIFNFNDGSFRCPSSQQGYSPFSTWTRGLAWAILGFAEQLEFLDTLNETELTGCGGKVIIEKYMLRAAIATGDYYIENTPTDGIPYWDTGAPMLYKLGDYLNKPADPFNEYEPVDSSAAAITSQGFLRLGHYLFEKGEIKKGEVYWQTGLTILDSLFDEPYLSTGKNHQGLILHSVYHRPKGWDNIPSGHSIPCGESSMWGDYHAREVALYVQRIYKKEPYLTFCICC